MSARIVLVRHGETEWSAARRHTGRTDVPLSAEGREEARALRALVGHWRFTMVLTSPLSRAVETAALAGLAGEQDPDLAEWDYGVYEGRTTDEIRREIPGFSVWSHPIEGGESIEQVAVRARRVLARADAVDGAVALVGHAHQLRILTACWLELEPVEGRRFELGAAGVSTLGLERETHVVELWNLTPDVRDGRLG